MDTLEKYTGERTIWYNPGSHLKEFRQIANYYMEAMEHAKGKLVVDVGCGNGFGTFLLSLVAEHVYGIDVYHPVELEEERYRLPFQSKVAKFLQLDLEKEPVDITADLCVAIELIEHLENPSFFLSNLKANSLFFTIPCYGNKNPYHKIEYDEEKAAALIRMFFPHLTYRMEARRMIGYAYKEELLP